MKTRHQIFFEELRKQVNGKKPGPPDGLGAFGGEYCGYDSRKADSREIMKELEQKFNELLGNPDDS